ncbi:G protein-coupled receptor, rhodopsin-like [Sergentomyia squamirostris]
MNNSTQFDNEELLMEPWGYISAAVVLAFIGFFGFTFNLSVIVLMFKDFNLWTPMNIILFNLICSDFSVSILGIGSITTLTVLSYERCCLVSSPFTTKQLTKSHAVFAIVLIWSYSFMLTSPPLFGWGEYVNEAANISCSVNWESQTSNATSYIVFLFIMGLIVPVIVISYSYSKIIWITKKKSARLRKTNRTEHLTWMVAVMIIAFLIAWSPYSVFALLEQFASPDIISPGAAVLPALIAKSSICYNPVIYIGMNTQYRSSWRKYFGKGGGKSMADSTVNPTRSTSNNTIYCQIDLRKKSHKITAFLSKSRKMPDQEDQNQNDQEMSVMMSTEKNINNSEDKTYSC